MNVMKLDLRTVRVWLEKWETSNGANRTASQVAAVMLSKVLEESEKRIARLENLMKDMIKESHTLQELEHLVISRLKSKRGLDKGMEAELKAHRTRMAAILREADEVMRAPREDHSIKAGGLLLEISRGESPVQPARAL